MNKGIALRLPQHVAAGANISHVQSPAPGLWLHSPHFIWFPGWVTLPEFRATWELANGAGKGGVLGPKCTRDRVTSSGYLA